MLEEARGAHSGCDTLLNSLHCPHAWQGTSGPDHHADPSKGGPFLLGPSHCIAGPRAWRASPRGPISGSAPPPSFTHGGGQCPHSWEAGSSTGPLPQSTFSRARTQSSLAAQGAWERQSSSIREELLF